MTYLVNAIGVDGYDPAQDNSGLTDERIAMSRLFMYGDCKLWVPSVVRSETTDIPPGELQDAHNRMTWYQLLDHDSDAAEFAIERRVSELLQRHGGANDNRVVAETEAMELDYLITRDDRLKNRLQAFTKVRILRPTELWNALGIKCAPRHAMVPAPDNPPKRVRLVAFAGLLRHSHSVAIRWSDVGSEAADREVSNWPSRHPAMASSQRDLMECPVCSGRGTIRGRTRRKDGPTRYRCSPKPSPGSSITRG